MKSDSKPCTGRDIVDELTRRAVLGRYFDFSQYSKLREIRDRGELNDFLRRCGYPAPPIEADAVAVVDHLKNCVERKSRPVTMLWRAFDVLMWIVALLWLTQLVLRWVGWI